MNCEHCEDPVDEKTMNGCWTDGSDGNGYGHRGLCCGCFDLSCGMSLKQLNRERAAKGKKPILKPWKP